MAKVRASAGAGKGEPEFGFSKEEVALAQRLFRAVAAGVKDHGIDRRRFRWSEQETRARVMFYLAAREARRIFAAERAS